MINQRVCLFIRFLLFVYGHAVGLGYYMHASMRRQRSLVTNTASEVITVVGYTIEIYESSRQIMQAVSKVRPITQTTIAYLAIAHCASHRVIIYRLFGFRELAIG